MKIRKYSENDVPAMVHIWNEVVEEGIAFPQLELLDEESGLYLCRTAGDAPEVDGNVCVSSEEPLYPGEFYDVLVDDSDLYDLYGTVVK